MHNKLTGAHIEKLAALAGKAEYEGLEKYNNNYRPVDGRTGGKAGVVLLPVSTEQVSAVLKYCNENKLKVFTQGGNTGLVGGSTPDDSGDGVVLSLVGMNKIISAVGANIFSVKVQAGVVIDELNAKLEAYGLFCSIKHGGTGSATAGGNVATNSGGENAIKYGVTRDQVVGLTVVLANGEVLKLGGNIKDTANNLMQLFIGSEGTLGVVTEAEFKVYNLPMNFETVLVAFDELKNIEIFLANLRKEFGRDGIESFEFMNNFIFNASKDNAAGAEALGIASDKNGYVLFEVSSRGEELKDRVIGFLDKNKKFIDFDNSLPAFDAKQRELLWHIREHCTDASRKFAGAGAVRFDSCVPVEKVAQALEGTEARLTKEFGEKYKFIAFGHWGDGNIHIHVVSDRANADSILADKERIEDVVLGYQVTELGGTASAEHGFGRMGRKLKYYPAEYLKLMGTLKLALDCNFILNPGIVCSGAGKK